MLVGLDAGRLRGRPEPPTSNSAFCWISTLVNCHVRDSHPGRSQVSLVTCSRSSRFTFAMLPASEARWCIHWRKRACSGERFPKHFFELRSGTQKSRSASLPGKSLLKARRLQAIAKRAGFPGRRSPEKKRYPHGGLEIQAEQPGDGVGGSPDPCQDMLAGSRSSNCGQSETRSHFTRSRSTRLWMRAREGQGVAFRRASRYRR